MDSSKRFRLRGNTMPKPEAKAIKAKTPAPAARDPVTQAILDMMGDPQSRGTILDLLQPQNAPRSAQPIPDGGFFTPPGTLAQDYVRTLYGVPEDDTFDEHQRRQRMGLLGRHTRGSELERLQNYVFAEPRIVSFMLDVTSQDPARYSLRVIGAPSAYAFACGLLATGVDSRRWRNEVVSITMDAVSRNSEFGGQRYAPSFYPILRDLSDLGLAGTRL